MNWRLRSCGGSLLSKGGAFLWPLGAVALLSACEATRPPSPEELVSRAAQATRLLETVHFVFTAEGTTAPLLAGMEALKAEGDLRRSGELHAQITARSQGAIFETEVTVAKGRTYLRAPLQERFQALPGRVDLPILDPDRGLAAALAELRAPQIVGTDRVGGAAVYQVRGELPVQRIAEMLGGQLAEETVQAEIAVREPDGAVSRIVLRGRALAGDDANAVRTVAFSRWNEPVSIVAPE